MPERHPWSPLRVGTEPIGLALSGGGLRAALAGAGAIRLLADVDLLADVRLVSSVSGGSITAGLLAKSYDLIRDADFDTSAVDTHVTSPLFRAATDSSIALRTIRRAWRLLVPTETRVGLLASVMDDAFFQQRLLEEVPTGCWFQINASNLLTGARFRFDRDVMGDYVVGSVATAGSGITLATAVAASAAVPHLFGTMTLPKTTFPCEPHRARLVDGGVYDNLGVEPFERRPEMFVVALNAGGLFKEESVHHKLPILGRIHRSAGMLYRQVSAVRSRWIVERHERGRRGILTALTTEFDSNHLDQQQYERIESWRSRVPEQDPDTRAGIAALPTTLSKLDAATAEAVIYRGWWLTGAALAVYHPELLGTGFPEWTSPSLH